MILSKSRLAAIVAITLAGLAAAYGFGFPLFVGFSFGLAVLFGSSMKLGIPMKRLLAYMREGAGHTKEVVWILLLVGLVIPAWTAAGTIPYLIDTGLSLLHPAYFTLSAFLFSSVIALILGTSTGTLSAVGIPLMGVAAVLDIPLALAAGALVSGAFVGDRTSPFSSANRLVASSTGISVPSLAATLAPTTAMAAAMAVLFYGAADLVGGWKGGTVQATGFSAAFRYHPALFLPPAILVVSILLRMKTRNGFLLSIAAAVVIGTMLQGVSAPEWAGYLWNGFRSGEFPALYGKGLSGMMELVILILLAGAFNGILEGTGFIGPYAARIVGESERVTVPTVRAALFGLALGLVSCTQTLPIMMTGRNLLPAWKTRHGSRQLARVVADTSLIFAAMVPWNMLAILCAAIVGVSVERYLAYAVFLWSLPIVTMLVSIYEDKRSKGERVVEVHT